MAVYSRCAFATDAIAVCVNTLQEAVDAGLGSALETLNKNKPIFARPDKKAT